MEHKFNTQINQSGRLMKEFVDTVISFYQNIKQQDVSRIMDAQTLSRLQQQEIPAQGRPMEEVYHQLLEDVYPNGLFDAASTLLCLHSKPGFSFVLDGRRDDQRL